MDGQDVDYAVEGLGLSLLAIGPSSIVTATRIQAPSDAVYDGLSGLSCPSPEACTVAGGDSAGDGAFALAGPLRP